MTTEQQIKERRLAKLRKRRNRLASQRMYKNSVDAAKYKIMKRIIGPDGYTTEFTKPFLLYLKQYQEENSFAGYAMDVMMEYYGEKLECGYTEQIINSYLEEMVKNPKLHQRFNNSDDRYSDSDLGDEYQTLQHYVSSRLPLGLTEDQETEWWNEHKWIMDDIQK